MKTERYVVNNSEGNFLTPRRNTGRRYECRSMWSPYFYDARIFMNESAANNAGRMKGKNKDFKVKKVVVLLDDEV